LAYVALVGAGNFDLVDEIRPRISTEIEHMNIECDGCSRAPWNTELQERIEISGRAIVIDTDVIETSSSRAQS